MTHYAHHPLSGHGEPPQVRNRLASNIGRIHTKEMRPNAISPSGAAKAVGPYSHAVRIGDFLFTSGQIPLDPATGELIVGDVQAQTERVLENIRIILEDQGLDFDNVVKSTVFMVDLGEFAAMNTVYAGYFKEPYPARSTIQVAALPRKALVEIEVVAHYSLP